mmetsp:Transcript_20802/g.43394  ORF Transcript_20802/g.43394 Transcript_20802/m.43394 type:complete len:189 (-) Transcript_20802:9-575(-)
MREGPANLESLQLNVGGDMSGGEGEIQSQRLLTPPLRPMAITWSPLPPLTWICPIIGHTGIAMSNGVICDFQGPYYVGTAGFMAFGAPTRYIPLPSSTTGSSSEAWDTSVSKANKCYEKRMHNICCDNCHSHVCYALNDMELYGFKRWNMVILAFWIFFCGRFKTFGDVVKTFLPFTVLMCIIFLLKS